MTLPDWWIDTRARSSDQDYARFGVSDELPAKWWAPYAARTSDGDPWFVVEVDGEGSWRSFWSPGSTERLDHMGRAIRNSLIVSGTRPQRDTLLSILRAFLMPDCPLKRSLEQVCSEQTVTAWFSTLDTTPGSAAFDIETASAIAAEIFELNTETISEVREVHEPGLFEVGAPHSEKTQTLQAPWDVRT